MSKKYSFNKEDLKKIALGALVAVIGAFLTYVMEQLPNVDFGVHTPFVVAVVSIAVNGARKFITGK